MIQRVILACFALLLASPAGAAPVTDTAEWAQRFTQSALKSNPDEILVRVREVADPRLNVDGLRSVLDRISGVVGSQPGEYAEQFDQRNIGTFLRRINVAVKYPKTFMFYSLIFERDPQGWQLVQFNFNTNINDILALKWPE